MASPIRDISSVTERQIERLHQSYSVTESGCWEWRLRADATGYGQFRWNLDGRTLSVQAHRAVYLDLIGEIKDGLVLDHLCKNRICVNPEHLEPVTVNENVRRSSYLPGQCRRGHPWEGNERVKSDGNRQCNICYEASWRARNARKRQV